jgi:hypothetical protein
MTDSSILTFGAHAGQKLANVPASWLLWVYSVYTSGHFDANTDEKRSLVVYIRENYEDLNQ